MLKNIFVYKFDKNGSYYCRLLRSEQNKTNHSPHASRPETEGGDSFLKNIPFWVFLGGGGRGKIEKNALFYGIINPENYKHLSLLTKKFFFSETPLKE